MPELPVSSNALVSIRNGSPDDLHIHSAAADQVIDVLRNNAAADAFDQLVEGGAITKEVASILRADIVKLFAEVRKLLGALSTLNEGEDDQLGSAILTKAKEKLIQGISGMREEVRMILMLSDDKTKKLRVLASIMDARSLTDSEINQAVPAIHELLIAAPAIVEAAVKKILTTFVDEFDLDVALIANMKTKVEGKEVHVHLATGNRMGDSLEALKATAKRLFPNISFRVKYVEDHTFVGGGNTRANGTGSLTFIHSL